MDKEYKSKDSSSHKNSSFMLPCTSDANSLEILIQELKNSGYKTIAPVLKDGAIIYDEVSSSKEFPIGLTDEQEKAYYRIVQNKKKTYFHYTVGPHSWKKYLFPPSLKLWEAKRESRNFKVQLNENSKQKFAFIGIRACELNAILIQDRVFNNNQFSDDIYRILRENVFFIAVNCTKANPTCFCVSMNTGPKVKAGYDIALTEIYENNKHYFLIETGSLKGQEVIKKIKTRPATKADISKAEKLIKKTASSMTRTIDNNGIKELLYSSFSSPYWDEIAKRCLTCANCTLVCPTCFCYNVEDTTDLTGTKAERKRVWDSCFTLAFSKVAGGNFRSSPKARYRQWMTHKLAYWIDQFGTSGCVGCGRCITWCPVKIDITEEAAEFRKLQKSTKPKIIKA